MAAKGVTKMTPERIIEMQRAVMSESGADPTRAYREIQAKLDNDRKRRDWERRNRRRR